MRLHDYIRARDAFISSEVYAEFRDPLVKAGVPAESTVKMVDAAFLRAISAWQKAEDANIAEALSKSGIPSPRRS